MNNPYPTRAALHAEAIADGLLTEQAAVTAAFHAIVRTARAAIAALDFPLGLDAGGYAIEDVDTALADWLEPGDARLMDDRADDAALDLAAA